MLSLLHNTIHNNGVRIFQKVIIIEDKGVCGE